MARETRIITIDRPGRDVGKTFRITEMPASKLERWCARVIAAVFAGNVPADTLAVSNVSSAAAISTMLNKVLTSLDWQVLEPLYNELLECVEVIPQPDKPQGALKLTPTNVDNFIEEVPTLVRLRMEVIELNLGFFESVGGLFSRLKSGGGQPA